MIFGGDCDPDENLTDLHGGGPMCKVIKRAGETGARIYPKGCTVRIERDASGTVTKKNKQGKPKIKKKVDDRAFRLAIAGEQKQGIVAGWKDRSAAGKADYEDEHSMLYILVRVRCRSDCHNDEQEIAHPHHHR